MGVPNMYLLYSMIGKCQHLHVRYASQKENPDSNLWKGDGCGVVCEGSSGFCSGKNCGKNTKML